MKRCVRLCFLLTLFLMTSAVFCGCELRSWNDYGTITVPDHPDGIIETDSTVSIDSKKLTVTFGTGSYVVYDGAKVDVSETVHDISGIMDGASLYFHPASKSLSVVGAVGNVYLGTLSDPVYFSALNMDRDKLLVDGMPVTWLEELRGKKVVCLGDSMTVGYGTDIVYHEWLSQLCGFEKVKSYGVSGSCISPKVDEIPTWEAGIESFLERYPSMDGDADVVVVFGGVNDWVTGRSLGNTRDTGPDSFYGAMKQLCKGLKERYPEAKIYFFGSPQCNYLDRRANDLRGTKWDGNIEGYNRKGKKLEDYVKAMDRVCELYEIPFCALSDHFKWNNPESLGNYDDIAGTYGSDALHPNTKGHELIALEMAKFICEDITGKN